MDVPAGMEGVFAFDAVSGCFGPRGLYMWGDGATRLIPAEEGCVATPKRIAGIEGVKLVRLSGTHVLVLCKPADETVDETANQGAKGATQGTQGTQGARAAGENAKRDREERREADTNADTNADESEAKKLEIGA